MLKSCSFTFNLLVFIWATSIIFMSVICGKEVIAKGWEIIIIVIIHKYGNSFLNNFLGIGETCSSFSAVRTSDTHIHM